MQIKCVINCTDFETRNDIALYYIYNLLKENNTVVTDIAGLDTVSDVIYGLYPIAGYPFVSCSRILTPTLRERILKHNDTAIILPNSFVNDTEELPSYCVQREWTEVGPKSLEELREWRSYGY